MWEGYGYLNNTTGAVNNWHNNAKYCPNQQAFPSGGNPQIPYVYFVLTLEMLLIC